jgi:hypothetical protein
MMVPLQMARVLLENEDRWSEAGHKLATAMARWNGGTEGGLPKIMQREWELRGSDGQGSVESLFHTSGSGLRDVLTQFIKDHPEASVLTNHDAGRTHSRFLVHDPRMPESTRGTHRRDGLISISTAHRDTMVQAGHNYWENPNIRFHHDGSTLGIGALLDTLHHESLHGLDDDDAHRFSGFTQAANEVSNTLANIQTVRHFHGPVKRSIVSYLPAMLDIREAAMAGLGHSYSERQMIGAMHRAAWIWKGSKKTNEDGHEVYARALADSLPLAGEYGKVNAAERRNDLEPEFRRLNERMKTWTSRSPRLPKQEDTNRDMGNAMEMHLDHPLWNIPRNDTRVAMDYITSRHGQLDADEWDVILSAQDDPDPLLDLIHQAGYSDPSAYEHPLNH